MSAEKFSWVDGRRREPLPIDSHLPEILSALRQNQVVVVEAETGAGKTTRIPQAILLDQPEVRVWMTQTRRPAVRWNGKRIAWEMGGEPGGLVGWRLRGETQVVSSETRLTLVVDQSLANRIRREQRLPEGVLIIDEAHERSVSTDLLLGLIKQYLSGSPATKVLITSATIDTAKFSAYFDGAPVVSVPGRCFSVETRIEDLTHAEHHTVGAIRAACAVMESFAKAELTIAKTDGGEERQVVRRGSVLALLPGKDDIKEAMTALARKAEELKISDRVEVLSCHSEMSGQEQDAVAARVPEDTLRFVCATEIVRSSVTVPETLGVIDSLQVKRLITDAKGVAHLKKIAVSKAEADQGKGRAGRTQPGFYIPISYQGEYDRLEQWPKPAILREPIASVVLQVAAVGLNARTFPFIDRPDDEKINVAIGRLQRIGALDAEESITERGRLLVRFPVDPERAMVLVKADELRVLAEAIVATAVLEQEGIFFRPKEREGKVVVEEGLVRQIVAASSSTRYVDGEWRRPKLEEVDLTDLPRWVAATKDGRFEVNCGSYDFPNREGSRWVADLMWKEFAAGTSSDYVAAVRAYRAFKAEEYRLRDSARDDSNGGSSRRNVEDRLRQWSFDHFLNYKRLRMVQATIEQLREEVASSPLRLENGINQERKFDTTALTKALSSGLVDQVCRHSSGRSYNGPMGEGIQVSYSSACEAESSLILIGGVRKIPTSTRRGGTSFVFLADMAAPVEAEWLMEIMPQLCESKLREGTAKFQPETGEVWGTRDHFYGNVLIGSEPMRVKGGVAAKAIAEAMIEKRTGLPAEWLAWYYRNQVSELGKREGQSLSIQATVQRWLVERLGGASTREEARVRDLWLNDEIVGETLGFDYLEYRERILKERPDLIWVSGYPIWVDYPYQGSAKIQVPLLLARRLAPEMLPAWENVNLTVYVDHPQYRYLSVAAGEAGSLKEKIEARRLDLAWEAFRSDGVHGDYQTEKVEVPYDQPLPNLPEPVAWDAITSALAYPAWRYYTGQSGENASTTWRLRWLREEEEAIKARAEAEAQKAKADAEEYERRNFDRLVAEAQALYEVVFGLWKQVDPEKAAVYGLSSDEVYTGYYSREASIPQGLEKAKELAGLSGYKAQPTKALEVLKTLKERIEFALETFAANSEREPEAKAALEAAQALATQVEELYNDNWVGWSTRGEVRDAVREAESAYETCQYVEAVKKAQTATERVREIITEVEGAKRAKAAREAALEQLQNEPCRNCGQELGLRWDGDRHTCGWDHQPNLRTWVWGQDGKRPRVLEVHVGEDVLAWVEAVAYSDTEYDLYLRVDEDVTIAEDSEPKIRWFFEAPSARERELAAKVAELRSTLAKIDEELRLACDPEGYNAGRLELTFAKGKHPKTGADQWEAAVRKDGVTTKYVVNDRAWEQPQAAGERWACTEGRTLVDNPTFKLVLVNPQVRVDDRAALEEEIAQLEAELAAERETVEPLDENSEPQTAMAAAFAEAGLK